MQKSEVNRMKTIFRQPPVALSESAPIPETKDSLLEDLKKLASLWRLPTAVLTM